jgi:hypothetical protein
MRKMLANFRKSIEKKILATLSENVDEKILVTLPKNGDEKKIFANCRKMLMRKNVGNTSVKC